MENQFSAIEFWNPPIVGGGLYRKKDGSIEGRIFLSYLELKSQYDFKTWFAYICKNCDWDLSDIKWQVVSK